MDLMNMIGGIFGGGGKQDSQTTNAAMPPIRLPDYAESEGARGKWWETLQSWGPQNGYGAIAPDWNSIWENARAKVQRHFMGGPEGPGAIAGVRSSLARRGMSENPASEAATSRLSMAHGNILSDMAVKQAIEEAQFGEKGRTTWLSSLQNLSGLKPSYMSGGTKQTTEYRQPDPMAQGIQDLLVNQAGGGEMDIAGLMNMFGGGEDSGIGDVSGVNTGDPEDEDYDWLSAIMGVGRMFAGDYVGGGTQLAGTF